MSRVDKSRNRRIRRAQRNDLKMNMRYRYWHRRIGGRYGKNK